MKLGKAKPDFVSVLLSREMQSEALRVLVPQLSYPVQDDVLPTLRAALQLGLRQFFGGQAGHLRYTTTTEPTTDQRRSYLVVYDAVPGGTGYLADLGESPEKFSKLVERAHATLVRCDCEDGCYRCLYAYQDSRALPHVSRKLALRMFGDLLMLAGFGLSHDLGRLYAEMTGALNRGEAVHREDMAIERGTTPRHEVTRKLRA